ncbi:hypothetical protein H7673_11195 [Streptococcus dysgalactiae subsp. equisimilis]|nr:hypothetical protein [Streptococcus dysgalactiae subsp. equisimilis]
MEYHKTLQIHHKCHLSDRNLKVGDVVIVKKESTPRNKWPLGLIIEVTEGGDGKVREVVLKTASGVLRRDVRRLCLLEGVE